MATSTGKSNIFRTIFFIIILLILILLGILIGTPSLLSSRWGQEKIITYINDQIPGTIELQQLDVSWFGQQQLNGIVLKDPTGNVVISLDSLSTDSPLADLIRGDFIHSVLKINGLNATIEQNSTGSSNLHQALGLNIADSAHTMLVDPIQIKDVNAVVEMSGNDQPILIQIKGATSYGQSQGSFEANAVASGLTSDKIEKLDLTILNFPIALLDQFAALENPHNRGLLTGGLGQTLDATVIQTKAENGMNVKVDIKTAQLTALLEGKIEGNLFSLNQPAHVNFVLLPAFLDQAAGYQTTKDHPLEMTIQKLNVPLAEGVPDTVEMSVKGNLDKIPFDLDINLKGSDVIVELKGERLQGRLPLRLGKTITFTEPGYLQSRITPERYQALRRYLNGKSQISNLELVKPTTVRAEIKEFNLPPAGVSGASFKIDLTMDQLSIDDLKTDRHIDLEQVQLSLTSPEVRKRVDFAIQNKQINLRGYLQNPYDLNRAVVGLQGSFNQLPAGVLCELFCAESKTRMTVESLLGPQIDGTINTQLSQWHGPVRLTASGSNGRFDLDGNVNQGVLTLNKQFSAEVKPTPELGQSVLQDYIPILSGLVSGSDTIKLYVANEGFSMPLQNLDVSYIEIGGLNLDLGRVQFNNQGELGKLMHALKARPGDYIDVWFTPIYLSSSRGVISISRFDLLAMQRYQIAVWGEVNIPADRVNMTVGLSGASLSNALGIKMPDKNYMMQFPLTGSVGHASIDKTKVMAKLAALGSSIAGGPQGMVVGAVIGLATGTLKEPAAPSPTTQPFPWKDAYVTEQQNNSYRDDSPSNQNHNQSKKSQNPVKGLKKEANKLIKNIFR